ncbi:MAG: DNA circularization N-terminal domain-containing protein [Parvibaculum sedimenti]|uniref:DNA circularization protein n=1 Tax=Parvibaculum sedimenti TaxID=2608632 RepID=UPI003BB49F35
MSWRDELRPASWRGVEFHVEVANDTLGRKSVLHKYPKRNTAYLEDLGLDVATYQVDAIVIGDDYMTRRDELTAALLQKGNGDLVHPYYGTMKVSVLGEVRIGQSLRYGGMATFSITFVETDDKLYPDTSTDTRLGVAAQATSAEDALANTFSGVFNVLDAADFVADEAAKVLTDAIDEINAAASSIISAGSSLTSFVATIEEMEGSVTRLLRSPATLAQRLVGSVRGLLFLNSSSDTTSRSYRAPLRSAIALTSFGDDLRAVAPSTPSGAVQATNQAALVALIRRSAIVAAARAAADISFTSYDDAVSVRNTLSDLFETAIFEAGDAGEDAAYQALGQVRAAMIKDISARGEKLARLGSFTPEQTMPALVIAYRLYGDAARAEEIVARNGIRHPGFVPGGVELEVLLDV